MNSISDCSSLDSTIPPKGKNQKQWKKTKEGTIKSIEISNNSISKNKSKEDFYSSASFISAAGNDATDRIFNSKTNVQNDRKQEGFKSPKSNNNSNSNGSSDQQNKNKIIKMRKIVFSSSESLENDYPSDLSYFSDLSDLQKDVWIAKTLKSIGSIKDGQKKQNDYTISESNTINIANNSDSLKEYEKEEKENSEKSAKETKNTIEKQVNLNIDLDSNSRSNSISISADTYSDKEVTPINCDRSVQTQKEIKKQKDKPDIKKNDEIANKKKLNLQMEVFDNVVHFETRNQNGSNLKEKGLGIKKSKKSSPRRRLKRKSPKKRTKQADAISESPKEKGKVKIKDENHIDSEIGQLELPSSSPFDNQPEANNTDLDIEIEMFTPKTVSPIKKSIYSMFPEMAVTIDEEEYRERNVENPSTSKFNRKYQNKKKVLYKTYNNRHFSTFDEGSETQNDLMVEFQKNADLLSTSNSEEDSKQVEKTVTKQGIVLYMLSSSDNEETMTSKEAKTQENNDHTFTLDNISQQLLSTESSSTMQGNELEEVKSGSKSQTDSAFEFENHSNNISSLISENSSMIKNLIVSLTIVQAHGLPLLNVPRKDPYCVVNMKGSKNASKTKVMRDTTSPIWNNKFKFLIKNPESDLVFTVRYEDKFGGDSDIAVGELPLKEVEIGTFFEKWIRLHPIGSNLVSVASTDSITSACELFVTLFVEAKMKKSKSRKDSPKESPQTMLSSSTATPTTSPKTFLSTSSTPTQISLSTPMNSPLNGFAYVGEINLTLTIIEAKNIRSSIDGFSPSRSDGFYCAVSILGRKDVKKTKTIQNTLSPIWDNQFKFTLGSQKDIISFHIRKEDKSKGDFSVVRAIFPVDNIQLNSFTDKWIDLKAVRKLKRKPLRSFYKIKIDDENGENDFNEDSLVDDFLSDEALDIDDDINDASKESSGKLHFNFVLEPRIKDMPVSPRPSPSQAGWNVFNDDKYPASPMCYYVQK